MTLFCAFTVEGNSNPAEHIVTYGTTVDLALTAGCIASGATVASWSIVGTSKSDQSAPTITPAGSPVGTTASFVMPSDPGDIYGRSFRVHCKVQNASGDEAEQYAIVGAVNGLGYLPVAVGELGPVTDSDDAVLVVGERNSTHGYTDFINRMASASPGAPAAAIQLHEATADTVGLWQFQESLTDTSGNGFDLSLVAGSQRFVDIGHSIKGLKLFTDSKYSQASAGTALKITGDMTILMIVVVDTYSGGAIVSYDGVGDADPNNNVQYSVNLFDNSGFDLEWFQEQANNVHETYYPNRLPPLYQPCHLVARRKNTVVEWFLNGRRIGKPSPCLPVPTGGSASKLYLGFIGNPAAPCTIASLRIDDVALTEDEIVAEYNATLGPAYGSLEASGAAPLYASAFGGTDERCVVGNVTALQKERTDTFSMLVRARWTPLSLMILAGKMGNATTNRGYDMHTNVLGGLNCNLNSDNGAGNKIGVRAPGPFNDGTFRDFLFTYDGTSTAAGCRIYVNGVSQTLQVYADALSGTILDTASFMMGGRLEPGFVFPLTGDLKDVAVWSSVVSGADALAIYSALPYRSLHTVGPSANLVGWWQMGDGATFPTIPDSSVNTNAGTMTNMESADIFQV